MKCDGQNVNNVRASSDSVSSTLSMWSKVVDDLCKSRRVRIIKRKYGLIKDPRLSRKYMGSVPQKIQLGLALTEKHTGLNTT